MSARLLLEYDGADFSGWARRPGLRTVQEVVEEAIRALRSRMALTVARRTGLPASMRAARWPATRATRYPRMP